MRTVYNVMGTSEESCNFELKIVPKRDDGKELIWFLILLTGSMQRWGKLVLFVNVLLIRNDTNEFFP